VSDVPAIRAAIFDLGGVVIDISVEQILRSWASSAGMGFEELAEIIRPDQRFEQMERGEIGFREYHAHVCGLLDRAIPYEAFLAGWNSLFRGLVPGIEDLLAELSGRVRLVALTNTNAAHAVVWQRMYAPVLAHFERVFMSHELGVRKPEAACFRQILENLELKPPEAVFIDDDPRNVSAAEDLGMHGIVALSAAATARALREMHVLPA